MLRPVTVLDDLRQDKGEVVLQPADRHRGRGVAWVTRARAAYRVASSVRPA